MVKKIKTKQLAPIPMEPLNNKPVLKVMKYTQDLLDANDIPMWFSAGTALGLVREECGYIKHDTDIDIETFIEFAPQIKQLMKDKGYTLCRTQEYDGKYSQLAFVYQNIIVDFYFYEQEEAMLINYNEHGMLRLPAQMVASMYLYKGFYLPYPYEEYLEYRYGKDWRIPRKSKVSWDKDAGEALVK